jgi:hypothetical protein
VHLAVDLLKPSVGWGDIVGVIAARDDVLGLDLA